MSFWKAGLSAMLFALGLSVGVSGWWIAHAAPQGTEQLLLVLLAGQFVAALCMIGFAWLMQARMAPALGVFNAQLAALAEGRFDERPQPLASEWVGLARRINNTIARLRELHLEREARHDSLRSEVDNDRLTGLASRHFFMESLDGLLTQSLRPRAGALVIIRANDLIGLNERMGRDHADHFLRAVAALLEVRSARLPLPGLVLARLNGADFGLLVPGLATKHLEEWLEGLAAALDVMRREQLSDSLHVAWLGATTFGPTDKASAVLARADAMLQRCATTGQAWQLSGPAQVLHALPMGAWRNLIDQALDTGRIGMATFDVLGKEGRRLHVEGVATMQLPEGRLLSGIELVPPATRMGRIMDIDLRVMQLALAHIEATGHSVAVNVSPITVARPVFLSRLDTLLARSPEISRRLLVEVDESVLEGQPGLLQPLAKLLQSHGCSLGIDHLRHQLPQLMSLGSLRLAYVKLDPAIGVHLSREPGAKRFAEMCLQMGVASGLEVIATGLVDELSVRCALAAGLHGVTGPAVRAKSEPAPQAPHPSGQAQFGAGAIAFAVVGGGGADHGDTPKLYERTVVDVHTARQAELSADCSNRLGSSTAAAAPPW